MVLENTYGLMVLVMKGNGKKMKSLDMAIINGLTVENISGIGKVILWMISVFTPGKTVVSMKVSIKMTKSMVMVSILGAISRNILAGGTKANNMASVYLYQEKVPSKNSESGKMGRKLVGLIESR